MVCIEFEFHEFVCRLYAAVLLNYSGLPLLYMTLVAPVGFLVNIDDIGPHYGYYNTTSHGLIALVIEQQCFYT